MPEQTNIEVQPENQNSRFGYNGKILRVNLSNKTTTSEVISEQFCRKYLGGAGFIAYYLWKELKAGIDGLSPDNKLIFALGPVSGMTIPGASRLCIGAKSPLSKGIAKSEVGGYWMVELKRAGFDAVIVEGKSDEPVYLWIHDGEVTIKNAASLWGKETKDTQTAIRVELGDEHIQVVMIGPAGENLVRFACIMEGCHDAAGRGGLGAVMGSKNLKAIAARGHKSPPVADPEKVKMVRQQLTHPYPMSEFGTGGPDMQQMDEIGDIPVRNFRDGSFPDVKLIHGGVLKDTIRIGMEGCFGCPIRCKKMVKAETPYNIDPAYGGPEYETLASLGSNCGINDLQAICKGNERCNALSLDTITTGSVISFAMECFEKGLLTKEDTNELDFNFGNAEAMLTAIELIARRKGFGKLLSEGTARLSQRIGKGCQSFALHIKGLEPGMHDPRVGTANAFGFALSPTGADHCHAGPDFILANEMMFKEFHPLGYLTPLAPDELSPAKLSASRLTEYKGVLCDSLVYCLMPGLSFDQIVDIVNAATGWDTGVPEMFIISERILTVMRLFNLREGVTSADDTMPDRFFQPTTYGASANLKDNREAFGKCVKYYYALMGWDQNGVPLQEKLEDLGIL
jgi:aldehyde:ferredoxin oxidoreductase